MTDHAQPASASNTSGKLRTDTLADSVLILLGMTVAQRLVGFTRGVLVCRWLSPETLGQWDMALGFLVMAGPVVILGLPGSFGRYAEHYRQRGQLRLFLRRTTSATLGLALLGAVGVAIAGPLVSRLVFGDAEHTRLVWLMAACLLAVIAYIYMTELFTALRLYRVSSLLQFLNSVTFATLAVALLLLWQRSVVSMLLAYASACLLAVAIALPWAIRVWSESTTSPSATPPRAFWLKLLPFALWVWATNCLTNLFDIADRYMLLHFGPFAPAEALEQVGHYHSARVVPVLLIAVASLMGSLLLPHLSHDWEAGRRSEVVRRVNLTIKLFGLLLVAGGGVVLVAAPWLFGVVFQGKYAGGEAVLPLTLVYCCWFAIGVLGQAYLWCCERARLGSLALAIALAANVALNLALVPRFGLLGAVLATAAANLIGLALVLWLAYLCGLRLDRATYLVPALPLLYLAGPLATSIGLVAVLIVALVSNRLFSRSEKQDLSALVVQYLQRLRPWPAPSAKQSPA